MRVAGKWESPLRQTPVAVARPVQWHRGAAAAPDGTRVVQMLIDGASGRPAAVQRRVWTGYHDIIDVARAQPVQREAEGGDVNVAPIQEIGRRGTSEPGGPLPHLEPVQQSFGKHDVSGIVAHTGAPSASSARAMGAEAFAMGHHVAFAGEPTLRTAAHEAAHVIQQQAGVHLSGGVGQIGDRYEQHADAVAEQVVQGRSAEALLDQHVRDAGAPAVQRTCRACEAKDRSPTRGDDEDFARAANTSAPPVFRKALGTKVTHPRAASD